MKSNLVRVDFRKNHKSQKARDTLGFRFNQQKVLKDADLKNKCNVGTYRLIKKAEANIKAVEKGLFGEGH